MAEHGSARDDNEDAPRGIDQRAPKAQADAGKLPVVNGRNCSLPMRCPPGATPWRSRPSYADGAVVTGVLKGLPADEAGLKVNDVVLAADGAPVVDPTSFNEILNRVPAGGSITLSELRAGERLEVVLTPAF